MDDEEGYHEEMDERMTYSLADPMRIHTLLIDGYYLFNGSRFSYAAAFDQSVIQRRSAGSPIAGAMYYHASMKSDNDHNADYIFFNNNVGRLRQTQLSLGAGYAYNWVPASGWLVSALAMPMLTLYDHLELSRYDSDYRQQILDEESDGPSIVDMLLKDWHITHTRTEKSTSTCLLNFDARLSLTYQLEESLFLNVYGQFYKFRIRNSGLHGRLNDWVVYASIGIQL